jgi:DNA polymerase/3'-5' exonuclease PolX
MLVDDSFLSKEFNYSGSPIKLKKMKYNTNLRIIQNLDILKKYNQKNKQIYKVKAYNTAIENIKKLSFDINKDNIHLLIKNKIVGKKIQLKIEEYLKTQKIQEVQKILDSFKKTNELLKIKGIGEKQIQKLHENKIQNISQLNKNTNLLNNVQRIGLKYHKDLDTKIPRSEITEIMAHFKMYLKINFTIAGSYRRKQDYSNDIDLIFKLEDILKMYPTVQNFKEYIRKYTYYIDTINSGNVKMSILLKSSLSKLARQVDIIIIPKKYYFASLLYFTGNKFFNERIRGMFKKAGYTLNEYYLYHIKTNKKIYIPNEEYIFKILKIKYIVPEKRTN